MVDYILVSTEAVVSDFGSRFFGCSGGGCGCGIMMMMMEAVGNGRGGQVKVFRDDGQGDINGWQLGDCW